MCSFIITGKIAHVATAKGGFMPTQHKDFTAEAQRLGEALTRIGRETGVVAEIERRQFAAARRSCPCAWWNSRVNS